MNGCEVEAAIFNVIAAVGSSSRQEPIIFPNPVVDKFTIQNSQFMMGTALEISIYNMFGELADKSQTSIFKPETGIDISHLPSGMYWLEISSTAKSYRAKFIKQ